MSELQGTPKPTVYIRAARLAWRVRLVFADMVLNFCCAKTMSGTIKASGPYARVRLELRQTALTNMYIHVHVYVYVWFSSFSTATATAGRIRSFYFIFSVENVTCEKPSLIFNGIRGPISPETEGPLYPHKTRVKYVCKGASVMTGVDTIECDVNGTWSASPPICTKGKIHTIMSLFIYTCGITDLFIFMLTTFIQLW